MKTEKETIKESSINSNEQLDFSHQIDDTLTRSKPSHPTITKRDSQNQEKDWDIEHAFFSGYLSDKEIPKEILLHEASFLKKWTIHKQNPGSYSCVGYAVTDVVYWHLKEKEAEENRNLNKDKPLQRLSARFNWMAAKEMDDFTDRPTTFIEQEGSSLKAGLDVARKYGSVEDNLLPTDSNALFQGTARHFYAHAATNIINSYFNLLISKTQFFETEEERNMVQLLIWKKWLAENGPILVRIQVNSIFDKAEKSPLKNNRNNSNQKDIHYHAALLVGYTDKELIIRNSWGTDWGEKGYAHLDESYALDIIDEAYGITVKSPRVKVGYNPDAQAEERGIMDIIRTIIRKMSH